ncbi:MAG TPA: glycosyltransferase [Phycisphaerae bacterium]|nr:glycosyltransferase [Phycisphaerae bacterium]
MTGINTHLETALSLQRQNRLDAALSAYRAALREQPANPTANTGVAIILQQMGKLTEAEAHMRTAIAASADKSVQFGILASNLIEQGRVEEACDAANEACRLNSAIQQLQSNRLLYSTYDYRLTTDQRYALHREWGRAFSAGAVPSPRAVRSREAGGRLRIGYVSADFRNHPVATFLEPVLRHHDHAAFEVFCYSDVLSEDATTARLRQLADHWISTRDSGGGVMTDVALAGRIMQDDIDILVDLAGHTQDNRLGLFAARLAPVQLSFIGYPCTTGLPAIGYRISDALLDPPGDDDALYSEQTRRLPAFWCYQPPDPCPDIAPLPSFSGAPFTFGSLNNLAKMNRIVIDTWSRILNAVPNSRLLLKYKAFHDSAVRERFVSAFVQRGIDAGRIEALPGTSVKEYMADFNRIDLALDPFPFNGGTTTYNSFYMGVPIVALEGRGHAERMGAALLRHVGLDDLVVSTLDGYVERAVALANDRASLAEIRATLRDRMTRSPLMDGLAYTRAFEASLRDMYAESAARSAESTRTLSTAPSVRKPIRIERTMHPSPAGETKFTLLMAGRDRERRAAATAQLSERFLAHGFELLYINDPPSLAAAYNAAVNQAGSEVVVLIHDDAQLLNEDAPQRILNHLVTFDLIGIAGTTRLVSGVWSRAGQPYIFGQVANPPPAPVRDGYNLCVFGGITAIVGDIQAVDGVFIAGRRSAFREIAFDETTFDGFHLYDTDFSFRAHRAGLKLGVANDIHLFHQSVGNYDAVWRDYHERFLRKFAGQLPPVPQTKVWFAQIYCRTLEELREKMARNSSAARGFTY